MSGKINEELKKSVEEANEEKTFGEQFDFQSIFRVKEKKGLYYPISGVNKSGMICVTGIFGSGDKHIAKAGNLICLGHLEFATTKMVKVQVPKLKSKMKVVGEELEEVEMVEIEQLKRLSMSEVFTNLSNYCIESEDYAFEKITIENLMGYMCPNFDPDEFKKYHAVQVLGWYIEVTLKYSALIDDAVEKGHIEKVEETKKD